MKKLPVLILTVFTAALSFLLFSCNKETEIQAPSADRAASGGESPAIALSNAKSNLLAEWNFNGNTNDSAGGFNAVSTTDIVYIAGRNAKAGQAVAFNGSTSLIQIPNGAQLVNSNGFTLSFWILCDTSKHRKADGSYKGNFVMGAGFFRGVEVEVSNQIDWIKMAASYNTPDSYTGISSNDFFFNGDGMDASHGGWQGISYEKNLQPNGGVGALFNKKWAQVIIAYDPVTELRNMFINGVLMETDDFTLWPNGDPLQTATGLLFDPNNSDLGPNFVFGFGADPSSTFWSDTDFGNYYNPDANHFKGALDDVKIYHRPLNAQEAMAVYNDESN